MKTVVIASTNPVKIEVAKRAFASVFPNEEFNFISVKSESGVAEQPKDDEARVGAQNRLRFIKNKTPDAHFWMSHEGGVFQDGKRLANHAWIAVTDKTGFLAESSTASFYLPTEIEKHIREGMDLGEANDRFFGVSGSGQGIGAIGHLTDNLINRSEYYLPAAIIALSELKHQDWYK